MKHFAALALLTLFTTACFSNVALADHKHASINERQQAQKHRTLQGIKSGELTKKESARLIASQKKTAMKEKHYRSDGSLTKRERYDLQTDLNRSSKKIYGQKHDKQDRH